MKKIIVLASLLIVITSCKKNEEVTNEITSQEHTMIPIATDEKPPAYKHKGDLTEMTFEKTEHDFGVINHPDKVSYNFKFTNTGKHDLLIEKAVGSCGCTIPEFPKEPIKPGEDGKIKVSFASAGKSGDQHKSVTLIVNTPNGTEKLTIKASIKGGRERKKPNTSILTK